VNTRTERLKDRLLSAAPALCPDRAQLLTAAWRETEGQPTLTRRAAGFAAILREMRIYIQAGELLVGNQAGQPRAAPIFPEFAVGWLRHEIDDLPTRRLDPFQVSPDTKAALLPVMDYWQGKTHGDLVRSLTLQLLPQEALAAYDASASCVNQVLTNFGRTTSGDGHVAANHARVIRTGFTGLIGQVASLLSALDLRVPENLGKKLFYQGVIVTLDAAIAFAGRYAALAERMAAEEIDRTRQAELRRIAEVCRRVPAHPARTFHEALQFYWFLQLLIQLESDGHSISLGRLDQCMYPYYAADLAADRLTRTGALELVECFWLKCYEINKVREWAATRSLSGYPMFQTVTLGGQTPEGADATNDLSYLCLEATGNLQLPQPTVVVRMHDRSPDEFLLAASRCVLAHGGGMPGFFSDEVAIPALLNVGLKLEDARDWCVMGCSEFQVAGKFNTGNGGLCHVNVLKILELALNGGVNPSNGQCPCPGEGTLATFRSFEEVRSAFRTQLRYYLGLVPVMDGITSRVYEELTPTPFLSALIDYRLEIGRDVSTGGGPNYRNLQSFAQGLTNVADSMAAIKKLVFEEKRLTGSELREALRTDFQGPHGEEIRQLLLHRAPKYGNDDDYVDLLAAEVFREFASEITSHTPPRGGYYGPSTQSVSGNVPQGQRVGATPDGRHAGAPLADNASPSPGADTKGPTAVLQSAAKLDYVLASNGTILNLKFHPSALRGEGQLRKFVALLRSFVDLRGMQVQFNILSADVLRDAQLHPENYRNLVVKVAGYSALFSMLDKELQDQIIARTTHHLE
jgi:pyruvate formate-lyase/glycerol dehydratase family glycyl radical enzyme